MSHGKGVRPSISSGMSSIELKYIRYLPADVRDKLSDIIDNGSRLDRSIAGAVCRYETAEENGVTYCAHKFQPLTKGTCREVW